MADDIDIEEHDVLDNPRIKNIFPDLTRIKTEVPDSDDEDHMDLEYSDGADTSNTGTSLQVEYHIRNNHIILGSKRVANPAPDEGTTSYSNDDFGEVYFDNDSEQHPFEFDENIEIKQEPEDSNYEEIERHGSCIILGSKPNRPAPVVENRDVYSSVVALEDWGPRLQRSNCYCKDCAILFPTRNCLDAHNMAAHSFLVALSNDTLENQPEATKSANKAVKSTTKNIQFSTKSSLSAPSTSKAKFCNHCNKTFPSDTALITHLYETLTAKKFPCKLCNRIFNKETELIAHIESHHTEADNNDESFDDGSDKDLFNRCHICSCYFKSNRRVDRHMLFNHSLETYPREKTPFRGVCKLCGSSFQSQRTYNTHVFRVHRQNYMQKPGNANAKLSKHPASSNNSFKCVKCCKVFDTYGKARYHKSTFHANTANISILSVSVKPQTSSNNLYKCKKCGKSFDSIGKAKYHRKKMHANVPNNSILPVNPAPIIKTNLKIKKPEKVESKPKIFIYKGVVDPPVPKSVLFKCSKCPLHFTNCSDAVFHSYNCNKLGEDWKCPVCSRCFGFGHKAVHERQHQVSHKFMVHLTNDSVYGRTLCQCPKCEIYYSEQEFWVHVKQGCGQPKSVPCNECNILIHVSSTKIHKQLHKSKDFTANQLILIEFVSLQDKGADEDENLSVGSKRKIPKDYDDDRDYDPKKAKVLTENKGKTVKTRKMRHVMFYCETCKLFSGSKRAKEFHLTGKCKSSKHGFRVCKKCGLTTSHKSSQTHNQMHALGRTIFDYTYIRMQDNKVINPMPTFPKCSGCGVHFLTESAKLQHDCNVVPKSCTYCKKQFSDAAYKLHTQFHDYAANRKNFKMRLKYQGRPAKEGVTAKEKSSPGNSSPMPELLKKYKQLTKTWNILYSCEVCDIVCDSYDKVVEHSQDHFNNMESYDMSIENCEICDLRFDATCFDKHKDLHNENASLDRQFFNVLRYNYLNLLSDNWFELFRTLPASQMEQIVSQSIYAYERNMRTIRMRVLQDGPPKNTVYKCGRCHGYLTASMVGVHMKSYICPTHRYKCTMCNLEFKFIKCLHEHQISCQVTNQTYREVLFNDITDKLFNQRLQVTHEANETPTVVAQAGKPKSKGVVYRFYKCDVCGCCSVRARHAVCVEGVKCPQCDLLFERKKAIFRHRQLHKRYPKLSKRTVTITHFTPEAYKNLPRLYRCQCGLHFTSLQTVEKHLTLCEPGYSISKEICSKCGLLFPTAVLVSHLCSHHSNDKRTEFHIIPMAPNKKIHTANMKASKMDATGTKKGPVVSENKSDDPRKTVYMCHQCNLCSMAISTVDYHFAQNHKMNIAIEQCDKCGLNFTKSSMKNHIKLHHNLLKLSRSDINVKVYKESPYAKTRLQKLAAYANDNSTKVTISKEKYSRSKEDDLGRYDDDDDVLKDDNLAVYDNDNSTKATTNKDKYSRSKEKDLRSYHDDILKDDKLAVYDNGNSTKATTSKDKYSRSKEKDLRSYHDDILKDDKLAVYDNGNSTKTSTSKERFSRSKEEHRRSYDDDDDNLKNDTNDITYEDRKYLNRYLYQCVSCGMNFLNASTCETHYKKFHEGWQSSDNNNVSCNICGLSFTSATYNKHKKIHHDIMKLNRDDFIVIKCTVVSRNLYKCEECDVHFITHLVYVKHCSEGIHSIRKTACDICGYNFPDFLLKRHTYNHHTVNAFPREYFNIITNVYDDTRFGEEEESQDSLMNDGDLEVDDNDESTLAEDETQRQERRRIRNSNKPATNEESELTNRLYKCRTCTVHFCKEYSLIEHLNDASVSGHNKHGKICEHCDLKFCLEQDLVRHKFEQHDKLKLSLKELLIIESDNDDDTNYATKYLYKCAECDTHFVKEATAENHQHPKAKTECEKCGLVFSSAVISDHTKLHHELMDMKFDDFRYIIVSSKMCNISERYKPLLRNSTPDNSIYPCRKGCGLNYITLRAVLDHASRSCTGEVKNTIDKKSRAVCEICGLTFSGRTLVLHRREQHDKLKLKLKDFIFRSDYDLETSSVHSESQSEDFGDTSSISHTESTDQEQTVSKRADVSKTKKGFDEMTKPTSIVTHSESQSEDFGDTSSISHTESTDQEQNVSKRADVSKTKKGFDEMTIPKFQFNLSSLILKNYSNQLYRCNVCIKHYFSFSSAHSHDHSALGESCADCGLLFTSRNLMKHQYIHHQKFGLTLSDFFIKVCSSWKNHRRFTSLYKCGICDAHFVNFTSAHAHTVEYCTNTKDESEICEMCGLKFSPCSINKHKIDHHRKRKLTANDFNIINYSGACKNLTTSSDTTVKQATSSVVNISDIDIDESETSTDKADESETGDIDASETSSVQMDVSVDDLDSNAEKVKVADSSTTSHAKVIIKLYKCGDCNVYYLTQNTCYKHMINHQKMDSLEYIECKLCGLQFRILTLHKHMNQHKTNFNLENVLVEEYRTSGGKTPKIDIYYALDKIQSRLVSTTTDSKDVSESNVDSTVKDTVLPVDDQDNTEKEACNAIVDQTASDITMKDLSGPSVTKVLATDADVSNKISAENVVKLVSDLATDGTVSKLTPKVDSNPSVEAVSTSTAKDIVDSHAHNVNMKENDSVVVENVTVSVVDNNEPSLSEPVTDSTAKEDNNSVATEDKVRNDVENNKIEVKDLKTLTHQRDEITKVNTGTDKLTENVNV